MTGIAHFVSAFRWSLGGFRAALGEAAFRQEVGLFVVLAPLGLWLGETGVERALLVGSLLLVFITELLNSAIEFTVDRIGTERHPLSGSAKDLGSAAVFVALVNVLVVWMLVLVD
ncbi:MAG: diacylglycerol kinase [Planctomycetes bacterium]|nr:diacylglycerol kinase [Planctomycetota bacterium]